MHYILYIILILSCLGCKGNQKGDESAHSHQVVHLAISDDPSSLDPRIARNLTSATLLHMLYEGLMRADYDGKIVPGIASSVTLSPDQKVYTFHLRKSVWSNGEPLTASHFEKTWKSLLDPNFPAPNAYQFYVIKGAKEAKLGQTSLDKVGVSAPDDETLVVELEAPTPYFLELVSTHFFYPVHPQSKESALIGNGPFKLQQWAHRDKLTFVKNHLFWDASEVHLVKINASILDEHTALALYENRELNWAGSPMDTIPQDAVATLKKRHQLRILPAAGVHWCRFNTGKSPFNSVHMRRALSLAIDRKALVTHVTQGNQQAALAIVPPEFGLARKKFFEDHDSPAAWESFQKGLDELNLSKDDLPEIVLSYASSDRNHKIAQAIQQQWVKGLGITVRLQSDETKVFLDHVKQGEYQIALGAWYADFRDPINFLELFRSKDNATNLTQWEDPKYTELLARSSTETDRKKRFELLNQAQELLMEEMPVAPLFFGAFNYVKSDRLVGVYFSDLGTLDFTYAFNEE